MAAPTKTEQIADELRNQIVAGHLRPGSHLPTEDEMMAHYQVSRNTVRSARRALINEGLADSTGGRGGLVVRNRVMLVHPAWRTELPDGLYSEADSFFGSTREQGHVPSQEFSARLAAVDARQAALFGVETGSTATVRRCLRFVDDEPSSVQESSYPQWLVTLVPGLMSPNDIPIGTTRLLAEAGYQQVAFRDDVIARMPSPEERRALRLGPGTAVHDWERLAFMADGRLARITQTVLAGDRNVLRWLLGDISVIQEFLP
jgi:GntR family transcriptional regulator